MDFYTDLRKRIVSIVQRSMREIRVSLKYKATDFADLLGISRQTLNNWESAIEETSDDSISAGPKFRRGMSETQVLAVFALLDEQIKRDNFLFGDMRNILWQNEIDEDYAIKIFFRIENGSFMRKWLLAFPLQTTKMEKKIFPKVPMPRDWGEYLEKFHLVVDDSMLSFLGDGEEKSYLKNSLMRFGWQVLIPRYCVDEIAEKSKEFFHNYESCQKEDLTVAEKCVKDAYFSLFSSNIPFLANENLNNFFRSQARATLGLFGMQGGAYASATPMICSVENVPFQASNDVMENKQRALIDVIQRLRRTQRTLYLTSDSDMANKIFSSLKFTNVNEKQEPLAELLVVKFTPGKKGEEGFFTEIIE